MKELLDMLMLVAATGAAAAAGHALGFARGKLDEIERPRREYSEERQREERARIEATLNYADPTKGA